MNSLFSRDLPILHTGLPKNLITPAHNSKYMYFYRVLHLYMPMVYREIKIYTSGHILRNKLLIKLAYNTFINLKVEVETK